MAAAVPPQAAAGAVVVDALEVCLGVCGITPGQATRFRNFHGINNVDGLSDFTPSENEGLVKSYNESLTAAQRAANQIGGYPQKRINGT